MQYRMARGALQWTTQQIAKAANISTISVRQYHNGHLISATDRNKMQGAFEAAGVIFIEENGEGPGVRLRKGLATSDGQGG